MMKRLFVLLALLFPAVAFGQGSNYQAILLGSTGRPVAGAQITVCAAGSLGVPCSPTVNIYKDQALTIPQSNPIISDSLGNFSFWAPAGTYLYTATGLNVTSHGPFTVVLPCIVGASCASAGGLPNTAVAFSATPSFAASFNASYAMPLTGDVTAITITGTPVNGNLLRFSFQQDSTGGHIVTWPGNFAIPTTFAFKVAPNQTNRLTFLYDGTNWQMLEDIPDGALDYYPVTFSATPSFSNSRSAYFDLTLTGNVTSSAFTTTGRSGTEFVLNACQDGVGGRTFAFPGNVSNPQGFTFDTVATHCNRVTYFWNGTTWTGIGGGSGGGGGSPGNPLNCLQKNASGSFGATNVCELGTTLSVDDDTNSKGPNPNFDLMRYGGYFEPSNAPVTSTCSITASSTTLSCVSNSSFQNGHGVVIPKAGLLPLTRNASFPAAPTVGTVTPIGVSNGSTTYSYQFVLEDYFGGLTAAGTAGSTTSGAAALGVNTVLLTAMTRVSGLDTFTCSTNCNTMANAQVQITGASGTTNSTVNGTVVVNSVVDPTHFTVLANGMPDYSESFSGTLSVKACNELFPSGLLTQESVIMRTWIYRGGTLVGVSPGQDPFYIDCGQGVSGQPAYVPSSVPGAAQAGYLATTVSSGGGTTTMTLAAAAGTTSNSQTVQHDNSSALLAAYTAALAAHGGVIRIPVIPGGNFNTFPFNATTNFTTVSNPTNSTVQMDFALVTVNQPWILPRFFALNGIPQTSTAFQYGPLGSIGGAAHPYILANASSPGGVHLTNVKFAPTATGQSSIVLDELVGSGGSVGWVFDSVAIQGINAPAIVIKGGFDFWFNGGTCTVTDVANWAAHPCIYLTNASTYLSATGTQAPGRVYIQPYNLGNGTGIQLDNAPASNQAGTFTTGGSNIYITRLLHESNAGPAFRIAMGLGTTQALANVFVLNGDHLADQANGSHQPMLELTGSTNVQNITLMNNQGSNYQPTILGGGTVGGPLCINNLFLQGCGQTPNQTINGVNSTTDGGVIGATNGGSMGYLMDTPAAPASCVVSAGGAVPITTGLTYFLIATDRTPISTNPFQGLTLGGPTCSVNTTSGQQTVTVTRPTLPAGATGWLVWRGGGEAQMPVTCQTPIPASTTTFVDTLSFGCGTSAPSSDTAFKAGINTGGVNASHFFGGAYSGAQVLKTSNFTFAATDFDVIGDPTGGAFTGTLPHAIAGQVWKITNVTAGANLITIQPDSGTILTPSGAASSVTLASGVSDEFTCSGTTCFLKSSNSGGSTNVVNCNQFGIAFYSAVGVANTINCFGPPVVAGTFIPVWSNPSPGATTPQVGQLGSPVNSQSGTYTATNLDRAASIRFSTGSTATLNLPAIAFPFGSNFSFQAPNYNSGNLTITPTTQTINGGANLTVLPGWRADVKSDLSPAWFADLIPTFNAFTGSCPAITFNSSTGFPCATLFYQLVGNNGTSQTARNRLNFIPGTNVTLTVADNGGTGSTDVTINSTGGSSTPSEDQVTALAANRSVSQAAFTKTEAWGAATGANINLWTLKDTANNTGTGFLKSMELQSGSAMAGALQLARNPTTAQTATVLNVFDLRTLTAADSTHNYYSPAMRWKGRYWTSSVDADDTWTASDQCANSGANPACILNFEHTGSTGNNGIQIPTLAVNTTPSGSPFRVAGTGVGNAVVAIGATNASPTANIMVVQNSSGANQFGIDKNFQVQSGSDGSGTNSAGGDGNYRSGISTGNAALRPNCLLGTVKAASGSTAQTQVKRNCTNIQTTIATNNTAQTIMTAAVASGSVAGGIIDYCVHMDNATDFQVSCGSVSYSTVNKAGTITNGTLTATNTTSALSTGTLTVTWALSGASTPVSVQVTANSSLTPTVMQITWNVRNQSDANDITVTSN